MNSKQRIMTTIDHKTPDHLAVDFGATPVSGMHVTCIEQLRNHYGLEKRLVKVSEPLQMLGEIDDDLKDALGIDTTSIIPPSTIFGFKNENHKEFTTPWGQEVLVPEQFNTTMDKKGDLWIYPEGDMSVRASGKMPDEGFFFDSTIRPTDVDYDNLNIEDNLEEFSLISDEDLKYYETQAKALANSDKAVVGGISGTQIGDIGLVPAPFLKNPKGIRDIEEWYISTAIRTDFLHELFTKQCEIAIKNLAKVHNVVGDVFDILFLCGNDFGTQNSSFCSTDTFDELYAPYYKMLTKWIRDNTSWKVMKHSCGAVENFMDHFIDCGFDIINPVQCSATGMDPQTLKDRYGDRLVFWGGGVDTQRTMPFEGPEDVRVEVLKRCEIFSQNGGFVFDAIHNLQAKTPIENIVAMFDALNEFKGK